MNGKTIIDQSSATAGRDLIGRDQIKHYHYVAATKTTVIEELLKKLHKEIDENAQVQAIIDDLRYFYEHKSEDGIVGLEAKLNKGNRPHEIDHAIEKKELFVKTLEKWSLYASAQEIFVHLLARAEFEYITYVLPEIGKASEVEINDAIAKHIVEPIVVDCGATIFKVNHGIAIGMFYWLAEQCFVRWHK